MLALGDDHGFALAFLLCDWFEPESLRASLNSIVAKKASPEDRKVAFDMIVGMIDAFPDVSHAHCRQARYMASLLPVPKEVTEYLTYIYARWDGKLTPFKGEGIPRAYRISSLSATAELVRRLYIRS
jgi:hypothetical protein